MRRFLQLVSVLVVSMSIGGCVSARQRMEEQRELERSIRSTSDPDAVKGCAFIMNLKPDGLHSTPEAQAASVVIPEKGVSWVVFGGPGNYQLYSCKIPRDEPQGGTATPTPVQTRPKAVTTPVETKAAPPPAESKPEVRAPDPSEAKIRAEPSKESISKTRITSNPEAVKGCRFLESFAGYQKVSRFQEGVVRAGGNIGYIVGTNRDGDVIGESYLCPEKAKP